MASTNCQISPAVRQTTRGRINEATSLPSAMAGATIHASAPIGRAAAAQMARMPRRLYCMIATPGRGMPSTLVVAGRLALMVVVIGIPLVGAGVNELRMSDRPGGVVRLRAIGAPAAYIPGRTAQ